jgi:hypothetical protein
MVMRKSAAGPGPDPGPDPGPGPGPAPDEALRKLEKFVDGCGGNDKFIDYDEEQNIFRKGGGLELSLTQIEAVLNRKCTEGGWTRQTRLTDKLTTMLKEATEDDGVIDQQEFEHIVAFAVKRKMPRKDAIEHCGIIILDNRWKAKQGMLNKWWDKIRKSYGL